MSRVCIRLASAICLAAIVTSAAAVTPPAASSVGAITRHAAAFLGRDVALIGYLLEQEPGYAIVSDESSGTLSTYDLPVVGIGADQLRLNTKYLLHGKFVDAGAAAANGSKYRLELSAAPTELPH